MRTNSQIVLTLYVHFMNMKWVYMGICECCMQQTVSAHRVLCSVMTLLGYLCVGCTCLPA